jgi:hypothetical protein
MKNLSNCTTMEFLRQINLIRHKVSELYNVIDVAGIRKLMPEFKGDETPEEKEKMRQRRGMDNLSIILDKCLDENLELTVEVIGLMCFKTKEEAAQMEVEELFDAVYDILSSKRCADFFTKWVKPVLTDTVKLLYPSNQEK